MATASLSRDCRSWEQDTVPQLGFSRTLVSFPLSLAHLQALTSTSCSVKFVLQKENSCQSWRHSADCMPKCPWSTSRGASGPQFCSPQQQRSQSPLYLCSPNFSSTESSLGKLGSCSSGVSPSVGRTICGGFCLVFPPPSHPPIQVLVGWERPSTSSRRDGSHVPIKEAEPCQATQFPYLSPVTSCSTRRASSLGHDMVIHPPSSIPSSSPVQKASSVPGSCKRALSDQSPSWC